MSRAPEHLRHRFWVEAVLASLFGLLFVVTFFWHDWMEAFGFDPDHGDGSAEWLMVAVLLVATVAVAAAAGIEWRRAMVTAGA